MGWAFLFIAGLLEIAMALALKSSAGWTRLLPSALGIAAAVASVFFLTHALKHLPTGVAYAIWTGMGSVGVALIGILWLGEQATPLRLGCIGLIVAGMIGLRLSDPTV
ncbi:MAG: multidrug efflux SMR transporter [Pseudomonadota bacterium]|nr:MAG: QacE family quaternary ammonium compound efflux SMR transporter [Pseudomonadota bacterium]